MRPLLYGNVLLTNVDVFLQIVVVWKVSNIWRSLEPYRWIARDSPAPKISQMPLLFKAEKKSAEQHISRIEEELQMCREQNFLLTSKLHKSEQEVNSLAAKVSAFMMSETVVHMMYKFFCLSFTLRIRSHFLLWLRVGLGFLPNIR